MSRAWTAVLSKTLSRDHSDMLQELFHDREVLSERSFTVLQKIVLQLDSSNLRTELTRSTATINAVDSDGNTALAWASQRNDPYAVEQLLRYGADPNIYNKFGRGPLHLAAEHQSVECMDLLVKHNAEINCADQWGLTPLLDACWDYDLPSALYPVMLPGTNVDVSAKSGRNALAYAATRDHLAIAKYLVACGASMNLRDKHGYSAIFVAIIYKSHKVLALLLENGAVYTQNDNNGNSILHMAADFGTIETLGVLANFPLYEADPQARNSKDLTAMDIAQARVDMLDGLFFLAFKDFIELAVECGRQSIYVD